MTIEEYINQLVELNIERFKLLDQPYNEGKLREEFMKNYPPILQKWWKDVLEFSKEEVADLVIGINPERFVSWNKGKAFLRI